MDGIYKVSICSWLYPQGLVLEEGFLTNTTNPEIDGETVVVGDRVNMSMIMSGDILPPCTTTVSVVGANGLTGDLYEVVRSGTTDDDFDPGIQVRPVYYKTPAPLIIDSTKENI